MSSIIVLFNRARVCLLVHLFCLVAWCAGDLLLTITFISDIQFISMIIHITENSLANICIILNSTKQGALKVQ